LTDEKERGGEVDHVSRAKRSGHRSVVLRSVVAALGLVLGAVGASACGGQGGAGSIAKNAQSETGTPASHVVVTIKDFAFSPSNFTVTPGAMVTVTNRDPVAHTFTSDTGAFSTGDIAPGQTKTISAPKKPGTYPYMCTIHQYMTGTLIVK
jgi:plastocyanin